MLKKMSKLFVIILLIGAAATTTATLISTELSAHVIYVKGRRVDTDEKRGIECSGKGNNCEIRVGTGKAILLRFDD